MFSGGEEHTGEGSPRKLLLSCYEKWKIPVELVSGITYDRLGTDDARKKGLVTHASPANWGGIVWGKDPKLVWSRQETDKYIDLAAMIHELAHILIGVSPDQASEINSAMLALELAHHEYCGLPGWVWEKWMNGFGLVAGETWDQASWTSKLDILHKSREMAMKQGLLRINGVITFKNRPMPKDKGN